MTEVHAFIDLCEDFSAPLINTTEPEYRVVGGVLEFYFLKSPPWGLERWLMVKSTDCSSRGFEFNSQPPHGGSEPSVMGSDALFWCVSEDRYSALTYMK